MNDKVTVTHRYVPPYTSLQLHNELNCEKAEKQGEGKRA